MNCNFCPYPCFTHSILRAGSGKISWTDEDETKKVELKRGDIYRLRPGTFFYIESSLEMERQKLRIYALFANAETDLHVCISSHEYIHDREKIFLNFSLRVSQEPETGPYTSIRKLVLGFDRVILEAAFGVSTSFIVLLFITTDFGKIKDCGFTDFWETDGRADEQYRSWRDSSWIFN